MDLDEYINLKSRVETRMKISVMTATGDDDLINAEEKGDLEYRKAQLKRLQEEVVDIEDMFEGISIMDLGLNEFRLDLLEYLKTHPDIERKPRGLHAVVPATEELSEGVIFVLRNVNNSVNIDNQNRMIINSQAFNARGKDARRIYMKLDEFRSRRPIDIIAKTNPVIIIDEPQSVEGKQTKERLREFHPLMTLRYSATHKADSIYNMIYRLDAMEAYNKRLVKKIAVKGITESGSTATESYVYLQSINLSKADPTATIQFDYKGTSGIRKVTQTVGIGFNLYDQSNGMEEYRNNFVVK